MSPALQFWLTILAGLTVAALGLAWEIRATRREMGKPEKALLEVLW